MGHSLTWRTRCRHASWGRPSGEQKGGFIHLTGPAEVLNHAEVKAVNDLLWARRERGLPDGPEALRDFRASVEFVFIRDQKTGLPGKPAPFCANCCVMLREVPSSNGRFTGSPPTGENWIPG